MPIIEHAIAHAIHQDSTIRVPEQSTNIGFGDPDRKTLYIAARTGM